MQLARLPAACLLCGPSELTGLQRIDVEWSSLRQLRQLSERVDHTRRLNAHCAAARRLLLLC